MKPLPFYIAPFTKEMASRQLIAHTARGIALQLTSPADLPTPRHRLDLAFVLGISSYVRWYAAPSRHSGKLSTQQSSLLLHWAGQYWQRPLGQLDLNAIELAINALPDSAVDTVCSNINSILNYFYVTNRDKATAMNLTPNQLPPDVLSKLEMSLASLEASLLAKDIMMPTHLKSVHSLLITYPESVQLLTDSEVARIIDGAEIMTKTEIIKAAAPKTSKAKAAKVSADEL
jgi:hypothetical protein